MTCTHNKITSWRLEDGSKVPLWSCAQCRVKFEPVNQAKPLSAKQRTAIVICFDSGIVSVSMVQRKMGISYLEAQALCQSIVDVGIMDGLEISPVLESKIKERA